LNDIKALWSENRRYHCLNGHLRLEKISVVAFCGSNRFRESPHRAIACNDKDYSFPESK